MKKSNIDIPIIIISLMVILIFAIGILGFVWNIEITNSESKPSAIYIYNHKVQEWISPDGVHYWCGVDGYMAPRYNSVGNLVID